MKFKVIATSTEENEKILRKYPCLKEFGFDNGYITVNSLQDIMRLKEAVCVGDDNNELIVSGTMDNPLIEIYDAYRE